jgi:hypothetical protein
MKKKHLYTVLINQMIECMDVVYSVYGGFDLVDSPSIQSMLIIHYILYGFWIWSLI